MVWWGSTTNDARNLANWKPAFFLYCSYRYTCVEMLYYSTMDLNVSAFLLFLLFQSKHILLRTYQGSMQF